MNYECLCKIFRWLFARLRFVLIVTVVLSSVNLMSCKTQQTLSESRSSYHQQESLARYDSTHYLDRTIVRDTVAVLRTETIWREPDSLGNIYPLMTINEERSAGRQTSKNIASTRVDTMVVVNHRDGSLIDKVNQRTVPAIDSRASPAIAWGKILVKIGAFIILTIAVVIVVRLQRRFSFP